MKIAKKAAINAIIVCAMPLLLLSLGTRPAIAQDSCYANQEACLDAALSDYQANESSCYLHYSGQNLINCLGNAGALYDEDVNWCYDHYD